MIFENYISFNVDSVNLIAVFSIKSNNADMVSKICTFICYIFILMFGSINKILNRGKIQ